MVRKQRQWILIVQIPWDVADRNISICGYGTMEIEFVLKVRFIIQIQNAFYLHNILQFRSME